jgi:hypothetical protein
MRIAILALCLLICGCNSRVTKKEVTDSTGSNRLALLYTDVSSFRDMLRRQKSFDFHSVVWRTNAGDAWRDHVVISEAAFQAGTTRRRWVSEIHSLDATTGIAIIKVAEGDAPTNSPTINYIYSWREWSLLTNGEVRVLGICADPFEVFSP